MFPLIFRKRKNSKNRTEIRPKLPEVGVEGGD